MCDWLKTAYPLNLQFHFWSILVILAPPIWSSLVFCVYLIPPTPVADNKGYHGIRFLHHLTHQHWSHCQDLYLATNHTVVHKTTWCLHMLLDRPLFWSLQVIFNRIVYQLSFHGDKYCVCPICMLMDYCGWWYLLFPSLWLLHFYLRPPYKLTRMKDLQPIRY